MGDYRDACRRSLTGPDSFWLDAAAAIDWVKPPVGALDATDPPFYRWSACGEMNTCFNALDRHADTGRTALIYDSPVTGTKTSFTYRELRDEVAVFAGALAGLGVGKGDQVIIYMPMVHGPWCDAGIAPGSCTRPCCWAPLLSSTKENPLARPTRAP